MFGQQANKPFTFGSSTFGQPTTTFGQPQTSVFGQTSTFGTPATQQTAGLFGTPQPTGGLFGQTAQSAFGQTPQQNQQTPGTTFSFGVVGNAPQSQPSLFGQPTATQGTPGSAFGGGAFGTPAVRPTFGGFGTATATPGTTTAATGSLFGQPNSATSGGLFGNVTSTSTGAGVFGGGGGGGGTAGTSGFGGVGVASPVGTTIPFKVVTGTDTMMKNGTTQNIQTQHQCISCMKEYENKSLEELRVEDYLANRKQGAQAAGGSFGTPTAAPTTGGLFSAGTGFSFGGAAAATQNKPLFGGGATPFGTTTTTTTTQPAPTFGQPSGAVTTPFGTPTSSGMSIFGGTTTTSTGAFGGFGAATAKPTFGGFGTTPTSTAGATGAFGAAKPFGTTSTFGATTSTPFGASATTAGPTGVKAPGLTFSTGQTGFGMTSGGAFGAPASSAGFSFGTTTTTTPSLFGNKPPTLTGFGTNPSPFSFAPSTGAPFGSTAVSSAAKPFTGFGTPTNTMTPFGTTASNFNTSGSMFAPSTTTPMVPVQGSAADIARAHQIVMMTSMPLAGSDSFFKVDSKKEHLRPTSLAAQKAVIEDITIKPRSAPLSKVKMTPINMGTGSLHSSSLFSGLEDGEATPLSMQSPKKFTIKPKGPSNKSMNLSFFDSPLSRPTGDSERSPDTQGQSASGSAPASAEQSVVIDDARLVSPPIQSTPLRPSGHDNVSPSTINGGKPFMDPIQEEGSSLCLGAGEKSILRPIGSDAGSMNKENENSVGVILTQPGYYTKPPLCALKADAIGECWVENFTVGRKGYGSVMFPGKVNVQGLNLDDTVVFRRKEITVYPDDSKRPALGVGLNRPAEVTLEGVYPPDKASGELITDPDKLLATNWKERLERYTVKMGARFLDFDERNGSWVFRVNHFSRYGILEDDDEAEMAETRPVPPLSTLQKQQQQQHPPQQPCPTKTPLRRAEAPLGESELNEVEDMQLTQLERPQQEQPYSASSYIFSPASFQVCQSMQLQAGVLQGMKASLFMDEDDEEEAFGDIAKGDTPVAEQWSNQRQPYRTNVPLGNFLADKALTAAAAAERREAVDEKTINEPQTDAASLGTAKTLADRVHQPAVFFSCKKPLAVDIHEEFISRFEKFPTIRVEQDPLERNKVVLTATSFECQRVPSQYSIFSTVASSMFPNELASFNRSRMRPMIHQWTLARLSSGKTSRALNITMLGHSTSTTSVSLEKINFVASADALTELMSVQISNSDVTFDANGLPLYSPKAGVKILQEHIRRLNGKESILDTELLNTLRLCDALWGDGIPELQDPVLTESARKRALSAWITSVMQDVVAQEVATAGNRLQAIMSLLSGHQISAACEQAVAQGDFNLATLIAQAGHDEMTKQITRSMCVEWTDTQKDRFIDADRLRLFALLAGQAKWTLSDGSEINVCQNLDWLRCFALHLWYLCPSNTRIVDVLSEYERAAEDYATNPEVRHNLQDGQQQPQQQHQQHHYEDSLHVCFQLIRLFTDSSQTVEKILCPDTILSVHSQLEYRHCWLLGLVLQSLGYQVPCSEELSVRMACQLEALGLWQWAALAWLHVHHPQKRLKGVYDLICRHATATVDLTEREDFVANTLKVPRKLIYKAKALRASHEGRRVNQTKLLILADELNEAHEVLCTHLAVKAIINEQYALLGDLLQKMNAASSKIPSWNQRGRVYLNYIQLTNLVKEVLSAKNDERAIERIVKGPDSTLEVLLASLSSKTARLPKDTVEQRLCQIEIAKTTFTAYKTVLTIKIASDPHLKNSAVKTIFQLLRKLPLPEDSIAQEFKKLSEEYPEYLPKEA